MMEAPSAHQSKDLKRGAEHRCVAVPSVAEQLRSKIESLIRFASLGIADLEPRSQRIASGCGESLEPAGLSSRVTHYIAPRCSPTNQLCNSFVRYTRAGGLAGSPFNPHPRRLSGSRVRFAAQSLSGVLMIFSTSLLIMPPPSAARLVQDYEKSARGLAKAQHVSTGDETRTVGSLQMSGTVIEDSVARHGLL
jgi:hypothetical protein